MQKAAKLLHLPTPEPIYPALLLLICLSKHGTYIHAIGCMVKYKTKVHSNKSA